MGAVKPRGSGKLLYVIIIILLLLGVGGVYWWQHGKVNKLNKQVTSLNGQATNNGAEFSDTQQALTALPNIVKDTTGSGSTIDLITYLGANNTQCYKNSTTPVGWFQIVKEVNDTNAKMQYGCVEQTATAPTGSATYILAKKVSNAWQLISPTNQWVTVSNAVYPTCTMINDNKFTKQIEPKCAVASTTTGTNGQTTYTVQDNTNP